MQVYVLLDSYNLGLPLQTEISQTNMDSKTWINNYIHIKLWYVIMHPCTIFHGSLAKPPLNLRHLE